MTGYGVDIAPEAIADGQAKVQQAGLPERLHLTVGDMATLDKVPEAFEITANKVKYQAINPAQVVMNAGR